MAAAGHPLVRITGGRRPGGGWPSALRASTAAKQLIVCLVELQQQQQ
jgi:hypothetical protein